MAFKMRNPFKQTVEGWGDPITDSQGNLIRRNGELQKGQGELKKGESYYPNTPSTDESEVEPVDNDETFTFGDKSYNLNSKVSASQPAGDPVYMALYNFQKEGGELTANQRKIMKQRALAVEKNYWKRNKRA